MPGFDDAVRFTLTLLDALISALAPIDGGAAALAAAIVLLTVVVRLALVPLALRRAAAARARSLSGSLLPTLVQLPVFAVLYSTFRQSTVDGQELFGTTLGAHGPAAGWLLVALLVGLAVVATLSARRMLATGSPRWLTVTPYLTLVPALFVPMTVGIYLLTSSAWSVGEAMLLSG